MTPTDKFWILYPERKFVPSDVIARWYEDAKYNGELACDYCDAHDTLEKALALHDSGLITLAVPNRLHPVHGRHH